MFTTTADTKHSVYTVAKIAMMTKDRRRQRSKVINLERKETDLHHIVNKTDCDTADSKEENRLELERDE